MVIKPEASFDIFASLYLSENFNYELDQSAAGNSLDVYLQQLSTKNRENIFSDNNGK
ncbi:MAG: hypothetical protein IPM96_21530 [Ignavibacteria bacterium]|nr:hypothetical protein [Ignavibacteria bacterium]